MSLTQEAILNALLEGGGRLKNVDLLGRFKEPLNRSDPAEKKQNRDLFKTFVNNVAVVKEFDDVKYIVLKKLYHRLLNASSQDAEDKSEDKSENLQHAEGETRESSSSKPLSRIETVLERSRNVDFAPKTSSHFTVPLKEEPQDVQSAYKPHALPLRMPQVDLSQRRPELQPSPPCKRSTTFTRPSKTLKEAEEVKYQSNRCPLDPAEHELLVKSAAGQWTHVYGLLLRDALMAEKKDFMSGFTVLHWAVKCGNVDMVSGIIELSEIKGSGLDINSKSNGGYTPLHIAAIHHQPVLMDLLLQKYGADGNVRDNAGKKPYHYLRRDVPTDLRERLGDPKARRLPDDCESQKNKTRLFPSNAAGLKKKIRTRTQFISLSDDGRTDRDQPGVRKQRPQSDAAHRYAL